MLSTVSPHTANSMVDHDGPVPKLQTASLASAGAESVRHTSNRAEPMLGTAGYVIPPGHHEGLGLGVPNRKAQPHTADNIIYDPLDRSREPAHKTLSDLKHARRMAQRADMSFDLNGDGMVDQTDFFFATRFDTDGSGVLSREERLAARRLMREESAKYVHVKGGTNAASAAHRVMQQGGVVISEQLDGFAALTRAKMGSTGGGLPFEMDAATTAILNPSGGALVKEHIDVDMDDSDNVALMHVKGVQVDYDTITCKPAYREKHHKSGAHSQSELRHIRKTKAKPDMSYDLDGDAMVSQKDYFFAQRFDVDGDGFLTEEEKAAATDAMKNGFGKRFAFIKGGGGQDAHHRVMQKDGIVLSDETEGGWNALAKARMSGNVARIGADGQIKEGDDDGQGGITSGDGQVGSPVHKIGLTENGRIAYETVAGAVVDFDNVVTKPGFRPALHQTGARTRKELLRLRRGEKHPHKSFDLDGDGAVSQADYWFASRYDVDGSGHLDAEEIQKAKADYADGYQKRFVTLSSSGANQGGSASRVFVINGQVVSDGEGLLNAGPSKYEKEKRLATLGAVPGLDLPSSGMMLPKTGLTRTGALAGTYIARVNEKVQEGPVVTGSMGVVPGVARAIMRYPDGRVETYGGYAGGMGAGPVNNMTCTMEAVMGSTRAAVLAAGAAGVEKTDSEGIVPLPDQPSHDPNYISYHNETSFFERGAAMDVYRKAPFALNALGGAAQVHMEDSTGAREANHKIAAEQQLLTRTQLIAARRVGRSKDLVDSDNKSVLAAGALSGWQVDALGNTQSGYMEPASVPSTQRSILADTTLGSMSTSTRLPAYMVASVRAKLEGLPVLKDDLPHEFVKPGMVGEGVRSAEADTRTALLAARTRELKLAALVHAGQPSDQVALPELYPAEYNDHHAHGRPLVSDGQQERSKTKTQLDKKRFAERVEASLQYMPGEPLGVHSKRIHKFGEAHAVDKGHWGGDKGHIAGWYNNFAGSALDGHEHHGPGHIEEQRRVPDYVEAPDLAYDAGTRHTMRNASMQGTVTALSGHRPDMSFGMSAKSPRLIADGMIREEEDIAGAAHDPFKVREIRPQDTELYQKRYTRLAEAPTKINPWEVAAALAPEDPASAFRPLFSTSKIGGRPAHTLHRNMSTSLRNGLPGPALTAQQIEETAHKSLPQGAKWTHAILDYQRRMDPTTALSRLESDGKEPVNAKRDLEQLYSSFSPDHVFHEGYMGKGYSTGRVGRPATAENRQGAGAAPSPPHRRASLYGEPVEMDRRPQANVSVAGGDGAGTSRSDAVSTPRAMAKVSAGLGKPTPKVASGPVSPTKQTKPADSAVRKQAVAASPLIASSASGVLKFGFKAQPEVHILPGAAKPVAASLAMTPVRTGAFAALKA